MANLIIGPPSAPIVEFDTTGFLRLWSGGVAAQFLITFDASESAVLENAGINLTAPINPLTGKPVNNQFLFELNTSGQAVSFTAPVLTSSDPGLTAISSGLTINIPAGAPEPNGSTAPAGSYMVVEGSGGFELDNSFAVIGSFYLEVTPSQLLLETDAQVFLQVEGNTLLNLQAIGGIDISSQGIYGAIQLTVNTGLPTGYGFSLNAGFLLEVNTTSQTQTITGITLPQGPFAEIQATGNLVVGPIDVNGTFDFTASATQESASIAANGNVTLGPLGSLNVGGTINILASPTAGPTGVVGLLQTNLSTGTALSGTGFAFNADFQFEINTTGSSQQVTGFVPQVVNNTYTGNVTPNQTIAIQPGVMLEIGGTLTLVNLINIAGEFNVTIAPTSLLVTMYAHISGTLGLNINVGSTQSPATFAIDGNDSLGAGGIVIDVPLAYSTGIGSQLFSISANPVLVVNTSPVARGGISASTYELELNNASLSALGFTLSGSLDAEYSDGQFVLNVPQSDPLTLGFFSIGNANAYGYLDSDGQFSLTSSIGFNLNDGHGDSIYGSFSITLSNQGFSASASGGATVLGINLASVYGTVDIEGTGVYLDATVYVLGSGFNFNIPFGSIGSQHPANQIYWYSVPTQALEGGQVQLDAAATNPYGNNAMNYVWQITGPTNFSETLTGAEPTLTLGDPGTYIVTLTAGSGLTDSSTINALNVPPTIQSLNLLQAYADGVQQTITPTVTDPGPSDEDGGLKYAWTLTRNGQPYAPAGVNLSASSLVFTPPPLASTNGNPDIYTVSLTVTDTSGATATASGTFATLDPANDVVTTAQDTGESHAGRLAARGHRRSIHVGAVRLLRDHVRAVAGLPDDHLDQQRRHYQPWQ